MTSHLRTIISVLFLFSMAILLGSCKKNIRNKSELQVYVNNPGNKLRVVQEEGKVETSLTYKPWQLMLNRQKVNGQNDTSAEKSLKNKYFFVLSLSANHKELLRQLRFSDYSEMVQVMAFRMSEYVSAVPDHGRAISPDGCVFQQTFGMGIANQLLIIFDRSKFENAKRLKIKIKEFGLNIGNLEYQFNMQDINDLQNIKI